MANLVDYSIVAPHLKELFNNEYLLMHKYKGTPLKHTVSRIAGMIGTDGKIDADSVLAELANLKMQCTTSLTADDRKHRQECIPLDTDFALFNTVNTDKYVHTLISDAEKAIERLPRARASHAHTGH